MFPEWLETPLIVTAVLAVAGLIFAAGTWVGSVNANLTTFKGVVSEIKDAIKVIQADIKKIFALLPRPMVAGESPLTLTKRGKEAAEMMGARAWAEALAPRLLENVQGKRPFEIDAYADDYSRRHLSDDMKERVADCAYQFGSSQDDVKPILRVVLRDALLQLTGQLAEDQPPSDA